MGIARRLALGRLVSLSGGSAAYIALVAAIYGETGSAVWVSAAIFSSLVASVASAPFAGWIGDHFDRRGVLIGADAAAAAVSLAMAATAKHPGVLVVLLGLSSVAQAPFEPASAAALPNLVPEVDVPRANAMVAATSSAGYLVGPLMGGAVLASEPRRPRSSSSTRACLSSPPYSWLGSDVRSVEARPRSIRACWRAWG